MSENETNKNLIEDEKKGSYIEEFQIIPEDDNENNSDGSPVNIRKLSDQEIEHYEKERNFLNRYFSKLEPGSLRSSIISTSILSIGIGVLALPKTFDKVSIVGMVVLLLMSIPLNYYTCDIAINAGRRQKLYVYSHIIQEFCGKRWSVFFDVVNIIYVMGVMIVYQIMSK